MTLPCHWSLCGHAPDDIQQNQPCKRGCRVDRAQASAANRRLTHEQTRIPFASKVTAVSKLPSDFRQQPISKVLGKLIKPAKRRKEWQEIVMALHEASLPGGALDGWVFHGTSVDNAATIEYEGVTSSRALADHPDGSSGWTEGTHWGTPKVAAFYAEDLIESEEDPDLELAIIAVRMDDLRPCGTFVTDGQTVDVPLYTRLDAEESSIKERWEASPKGWQDCWECFGTLLVLGDVPADDIRVIESIEDVLAMVEATSAPAP